MARVIEIIFDKIETEDDWECDSVINSLIDANITERFLTDAALDRLKELAQRRLSKKEDLKRFMLCYDDLKSQ